METIKMVRYGSLLLGIALMAACGKSEEQKATGPNQSTQALTAQAKLDTCSQYMPIAADFINLYIRHLNDLETSADAPDTYEWLKANSLVDATVASAYAKVDLVDGDPILDAQDYPKTFDPVGCPEAPDTVRLKGNGMDLNVDVRIALVDGNPKVVGVGSLNMAARSDEHTPISGSDKLTNELGNQHAHGTDADCVFDQSGAPALGSPYGDGLYLCREAIDGPYYNEWYAVQSRTGKAIYRVVSDGKMPFEGMLTVVCSNEKTSWAPVDGYEDADPNDTVPAAAIDNVIQIACRS